jgi:hypothetical protein
MDWLLSVSLYWATLLSCYMRRSPSSRMPWLVRGYGSVFLSWEITMLGKSVGFLCLVIGLMAADHPVAHADEMTPAEFLKKYKQASKVLEDGYAHARIKATVVDSFVQANRSTSYRLDVLGDNERLKVFSEMEDADTKGRRSVFVANPERSFTLGSAGQQKDYTISYVGRGNLGFQQVRERSLLKSRMVHCVYSYLEAPLSEFLSEKTVSIGKVQSETSSGKSLVRVSVRFELPDDAEHQVKSKYVEGSFLFDPSSSWALQGFDLQHHSSQDPKPWTSRGTVEYTKPVNGIPVPRQFKLENIGSNGKLVSTHVCDIQSVTFGPAPPEEFTLAGYGFNNEVGFGHPAGLPKMFYVASASTVIALIVILSLRKRPKESQPGPAPQPQ